MRRLILVLFVLSAGGQDIEHAPTVAQCQADQRLWDSKIESKSEKLPDIGVLQRWSSELRDCLTVDSQHQLQYVFTVGEIDTETMLRMTHFLERRNMLTDFKAEDATGKR